MNWSEELRSIEASMFPHFSCDVWERSHYYYLLSQTRLKGIDVATIPLGQIATALGCSDHSSRKILRKMAEKGCIELEQTRRGHSVKVLLPSELPILDQVVESEKEVDIELLNFFKGRSYVDELLERENGQCFYCLKRIDSDSCELDHVIPQVSGGDDTFRNVVASCHRCNTQKSGEDVKSHLRALLGQIGSGLSCCISRDCGTNRVRSFLLHFSRLLANFSAWHAPYALNTQAPCITSPREVMGRKPCSWMMAIGACFLLW